MGCGCGKSAPVQPKSKFVVTWPDGSKQGPYMSKVEAQAALAAKPGGSISTTQ